MKISFLTQAIKAFIEAVMFSTKKEKGALARKQQVKNGPKDVKKKLNKKPYPVTEDQKFRNVSE